MIWKGDRFGTHTGKLYDKLCDEYGFDRSKRNNFGHQGALLYANDASPEGFSVWCLTNSNLTKRSKDKNGKECRWTNYIVEYENNSFITEDWTELWERTDRKSLVLRNEFFDYKDTRLTFVKTGITYYFLGVYKFFEMNRQEKTKRYVLISDKYPI